MPPRKPTWTRTPPSFVIDASALQAEQQQLLQALDSHAAAGPAVRGQGVPIQAVGEQLRQAFVHAARQACAGANPERLNSRISTLTGLDTPGGHPHPGASSPRPRGRAKPRDAALHPSGSPAPDYQGAQGPAELPRQGPAPSFEALAQAVTRDVHPRSLLEALCRLGLAEQDEPKDSAACGQAASAFVPRNQWAQMVGCPGRQRGRPPARGGDQRAGPGQRTL